jgi:hypothetical protein
VAIFDLSSAGVNTSGELAHTHLIRKFIASCDIMFLFCNPLLIETKRIHGICVGLGMAMGVAVRGDCQGAVTKFGVGTRTRQRRAMGVISGTLPGTLFQVLFQCVHLVNFKVHF